jgi:hypothetical protein
MAGNLPMKGILMVVISTLSASSEPGRIESARSERQSCGRLALTSAPPHMAPGAVGTTRVAEPVSLIKASLF